MRKINLKSIPWKTIAGGIATVAAVIMGGAEAYGNIQKEKELEQLKKDVAELKGKES